MPTIVREDHDDLNITLTVNIPKEDYAPELKKKLKKYSKEASIKGFRKGQVPQSVIRRMFGQGLLVEIINELLSKELDTYLKEADFDILGQPIPVDQEKTKLTAKDLKDYAFKFDIGLVPEFEVKGLEEEAFGKYDVTIPDSMIDTNFQEALKKMVKSAPVEDELQGGDLFKVNAKELGADGITPKENGLDPTFMLSFDELTEEMVEDLFTKKKGDTFKFDIFNLSKDKDEAFVKKHFLQLDAELDADVAYGHLFEAEIIEVIRKKEAELNQEFFDQYFGPNNVTSEEEAREKMRAYLKQQYDNQADGLLFQQVVEKLKAANPLTLPNDFLARWAEHTKQVKADQTAAEAVVDMQEGLQWVIIRNKLADRFNVKVEKEEIQQYIRSQIIQYMGGTDYGQMIDEMVEKMMKNQQQSDEAYSMILSSKLFGELKKVINIAEMEIGTEEFEQLLKDETAKKNPAPETPAEEAVVTEESAIEQQVD